MVCLFQMRMTAYLELDVSYFNEKLSVWEPLVEPNMVTEGTYDPWTLKIQVTHFIQTEFKL